MGRVFVLPLNQQMAGLGLGIYLELAAVTDTRSLIFFRERSYEFYYFPLHWKVLGSPWLKLYISL
jgi:hypothetical protein